MSIGPVEYIIVEFPGNKFKGEIVPALRELTAAGTIRIIDLVFIKKDEQGNVDTIELSALGADEAGAFAGLGGEIEDLLNNDDIMMAADLLDTNSSAAVMVFEHVWVTKLRDAVVNANGRLVDNDRVPHAIVEAAMAAAMNASAG